MNLTLKSKERKSIGNNRPPAITEEDRILRQAENILTSDFFEREEQVEFVLLILEVLLERSKEKVAVTFVPWQPSPLEVRLYDQVARVVSKTHAETGEDDQLADDEALIIIRELLLNFDEQIIMRNFGKPVRGSSTHRTKSKSL